MPFLADAHLFEEFRNVIMRPSSGGHFTHRSDPQAPGRQKSRRSAKGWQAVPRLPGDPWKPRPPHDVADDSILGPDRRKGFSVPLHEAACGCLQADVEPIPHLNGGFDLRIGVERRGCCIAWDQKTNGELVCLDLLLIVLSHRPALPQIGDGADHPVLKAQHMALQQEVPQLMGNAEPRCLRAAPAVDQDAAIPPGAIGQQHTLATIQRAFADVYNIEGPRYFRDRDRSIYPADQSMQRPHQSVRGVDIRKINPVQLQRGSSSDAVPD